MKTQEILVFMKFSRIFIFHMKILLHSATPSDRCLASVRASQNCDMKTDQLPGAGRYGCVH